MTTIIDILIQAKQDELKVDVFSYGEEISGTIEALEENLIRIKDKKDSTTYLVPSAIHAVKVHHPKKSESWGPPTHLGDLGSGRHQ